MSPNMIQPTVAQKIEMYRLMQRSRMLEEAYTALYIEGKSPVFSMAEGPLPGELHQSNGQEPAAMGVMAHLGPDDLVTGTHRAHHLAVGRGVDLKKMSAELLGKESGLCQGKGGHMHLYDPSVNFTCSGIIGEGLGPAAGAAMARKMLGEPGVSVCYIGEGAANQGAFHEVMNMASLWDLPFLCVIEDNNWGATTEKSVSTAVKRNSDRAAAYGIYGEYVAGNDADVIFDAAARALDHIRSGKGPVILEIETARLIGHFFGDPQRYIPEDHAELATRIDPLPNYRERLIADGVATEDDLGKLEAEEKARIEEASSFATESEYPPAEAALEQVFA